MEQEVVFVFIGYGVDDLVIMGSVQGDGYDGLCFIVGEQ